MVDTPFDYETITSLYDSSGVLQNQGSYTPYSRDKILRLRDDIDTQGEILGITGANWTVNNFNWTKGDRYNLDTDKRLWLSYIADMRTACEELATEAGISAPTWTVDPLVPLYKRGKTATISGTVMTQTGADFDDVTASSDYCYIQSGTGATVGRYLISAKTTDTLTLTGYSGDSGAGDVVYDVLMTDKMGTYTTSNLKSLITDIQTAILAVQDDTGTFKYFVDSENGDDTTGDGSRTNPYETWNKAVTECNSAAGNIYFFAGDYTANLPISQSGIIIHGQSPDSVVIGVSDKLAAAINFTARNIWFGDGTGENYFIDGYSGFLFEFCVFLASDAGAAPSWAALTKDADGEYNHCTAYGRKEGLLGGQSSWDNPVGDMGIGVAQGTNTVLINNCIFKHLWSGAASRTISSATITIDDNTVFDDIGAGGNTSGGGTFTAFTPFSFAGTNIADVTTMYLYDDCDLVGAASDGLDIGAYPNAPYNIIRTATESISLTESAEMSLLITAQETININEDLSSINMNVSIDMPFWGLFESDNTGDVIYLTNALITASPRQDKIVGTLSSFQYNGASLDVSWDNTTGDLFEVYIVADDGVSDYAPVAWWENNALFPAASTTNVNGTRGYAIDCYTEAELDEDWGDQGAFSTVTADGYNDQQWDLTLKVRIKNTISGVWSELISLSKTYAFNTFEGTMAYCADNPRVVDNEYADHANYMLNSYHTTDGPDKLKYTRPDGVDFADDDRRYAYAPAFKSWHHIIYGNETPPGGTPAHSNGGGIYLLWYFRGKPVGTIDIALTRERVALYPPIWANYGNWNHNSDHCFASVFNDVYDGGTYNSATPVLGSSTNKVRYVSCQAYLGTDCSGHSSFRGFFYYMPSNELMSHSNFGTGDGVHEMSDLLFVSSKPNACDGPRFYLEEHNVQEPFGDRVFWWFTKAEVRINQATIKGSITFNASHNASDGVF